MSFDQITLAGHKLDLKVEYARLLELERELGSLFGFVERAGGGDLKLGEIIAMIDHLWDRPLEIDRAKIGEAIADLGLSKLMPAIRRVLGQILQGR